MCGIIGYAGKRPAVPVVMEGLRRLEYRGYDSAGVAWELNGEINIARASGKLRALEEKLEKIPTILSTCAMGHTRWATHGAPVERNAHPHVSYGKTLAIIHNGIIENYMPLKRELRKRGYEFYSDTDTEVLVNLVEERRKSEPTLLAAFAAALKEAKGAYAVCLLTAEEPGVIYAARMAAPLVLGVGVEEYFVASDIPAFLPYTRDVVFPDNGEIIRLDETGYRVLTLDTLKPVEKEARVIQWDMQAARKDGYRHFMLKEIFEQPRVIGDGMTGRVVDQAVCLPELDKFPTPERVHIVACGTSYHSGLWAVELFETLADLPVSVSIASEFRYRPKHHFGPRDIALFISQSGETADTLAALRAAREYGVATIGVCNVVGSSLSREADAAIFTQAGPEISVASTKAMTSQMLVLALAALYWGTRKKTLPSEKISETLETMRSLPALLDDNLPEMRKRAKELTQKFSTAENFFYLGRGFCFPLALEGALKLKELSYVHAEGYPAGEMKHGPIALIDPSFPSFFLAPPGFLLSKIKSNIQEVESRAGKVVALTCAGTDVKAGDRWEIPRIDGPLWAFLALPALQLFSYEMADFLGKDVDQPRNLAKSVTVE